MEYSLSKDMYFTSSNYSSRIPLYLSEGPQEQFDIEYEYSLEYDWAATPSGLIFFKPWTSRKAFYQYIVIPCNRQNKVQYNSHVNGFPSNRRHSPVLYLGKIQIQILPYLCLTIYASPYKFYSRGKSIITQSC